MAGSVIELRYLSLCMWHCKTFTSGCPGDLWSKNLFLIVACEDTIFKGRPFFVWKLLKHETLDQPTVDSGRIGRGRLWLLAVVFFCILMALQRHFHCPFTALPTHFNGNSTALYWCFYPHRSKESVSSICMIFLYH